MPTENCLFCLEPVGAGDLVVPSLPCMCRTWHHDECRARWNAINPYRCPICRKTFTPESASPYQPYPQYQETLYITIPSPPPSPSAPPAELQRPVQTPPIFQTQMTPQERRRFLFDAGCKAIACLGLMLILLVVILIIKGT